MGSPVVASFVGGGVPDASAMDSAGALDDVGDGGDDGRAKAGSVVTTGSAAQRGRRAKTTIPAAKSEAKTSRRPAETFGEDRPVFSSWSVVKVGASVRRRGPRHHQVVGVGGLPRLERKDLTQQLAPGRELGLGRSRELPLLPLHFHEKGRHVAVE
jgi:hypothetical protein